MKILSTFCNAASLQIYSLPSLRSKHFQGCYIEFGKCALSFGRKQLVSSRECLSLYRLIFCSTLSLNKSYHSRFCFLSFVSNLNEWIQEGIPFCTGKDATSMLDKYLEQEMKKKADAAKPSPDQSQRRAVELTRNEDKDFHARAMASLREWLDAAVVVNPGDLEGSSFHLPPCNSFLRRALYESIGKEYPNLVLETTPGTSQMRVWRLNAEERARRSERLLREGFEKLLTEKIGGWRVFLALALACRYESFQRGFRMQEHVPAHFVHFFLPQKWTRSPHAGRAYGSGGRCKRGFETIERKSGSRTKKDSVNCAQWFARSSFLVHSLSYTRAPK